MVTVQIDSKSLGKWATSGCKEMIVFLYHIWLNVLFFLFQEVLCHAWMDALVSTLCNMRPTLWIAVTITWQRCQTQFCKVQKHWLWLEIILKSCNVLILVLTEKWNILTSRETRLILSKTYFMKNYSHQQTVSNYQTTTWNMSPNWSRK